MADGTADDDEEDVKASAFLRAANDVPTCCTQWSHVPGTMFPRAAHMVCANKDHTLIPGNSCPRFIIAGILGNNYGNIWLFREKVVPLPRIFAKQTNYSPI